MSISAVNIPTLVASGTQSNLNENTFENGSKPFLKCLKLAGLHHLKWHGRNGRHFWRTLTLLYRVFVPVLLIINFVFSLGEFNKVTGFNSSLLNNLISSIWFLQVTIFSLNNVVRCCYWDRFYKAWDEYAETFKINSKVLVKRSSIVGVCAYLVWLVVASAFMGLSMSNPRPPSGFMKLIPSDVIPFIMTVIVMAYFFFVTTWFLLTSQFALICVFLYKLLLDFYGIIKKRIQQREVLQENFEKYRQQHEKICTIIALSDDILSVFIMVTVFTTIPLIVLTLYFVLFVTQDVKTFSYAATWWSISLSSIQLVVVFFFGGAVNYMAHKPSELLYQMDLNNTNSNTTMQLCVFLNRLTSKPIGLTALGLFVLDKPTIITFVGSIVTYAIVMVQFKPGESSCNFTCNCTGRN